MAILRMDLLGSPNIGIYALTTNNYTIVPAKVSNAKIEKLKKCLRGEVVGTSIGGTTLVGVLATANSNGIILPYYPSDDEVKAIKYVCKGNIERIENKRTALGNLVLANDRGAIIGENLMREKETIKKIGDTLGVEVVFGQIAGLPYVGSLATTTNRGALAHPMITDEERETLQEVLKVPVDVGTINGGAPFVPSGLLANDNGVVIGSFTTGPEILIISNIFNG